MPNSIPIFLSSDNNYAPYVATTIASICDNTDSFCEFYILDGGISKDNIDKISALKRPFENFSIEFKKIDTEKYFKGFLTNSYVSIATYYRFIISNLFPTLDKALYLDVDIIAEGDILELYQVDLNGHMLAAVPDQGDTIYIEQKLKKNLKMATNSCYFNAGVLVIDMTKWRQNSVLNQLFELEKIYRGRLLANDQDVLNKYFENNYQKIDTKYNLMTSPKNQDCIIRHYFCKPKPWDVHPDLCKGEYEDYAIFWKYALNTAFYEQIISSCKYKSLAQLRMLALLERIGKERENNVKSINCSTCI